MMMTATPELRAHREKLVLDHFRDEVQQQWDDVLATFPHPRYELIATGVVHDGHEAVRDYYRDTRIAFPDQHHEMIQLRHADDAVICEFWLLGTHKGPFGPIPATGSKFRVRMCALFTFEGERLVTERIYFDTLTFMKQLLGGLNMRNPLNWLLMIRAIAGLRSVSKT